MIPSIVFVVLLSGGSFYFSNTLLPMANLKFQSLLYDATRTKPVLELRPGVFPLGEFKPKQEVEVEYLRDTAIIKGTIVMGTR